jgi:UDP-glucose 4-epimerase
MAVLVTGGAGFIGTHTCVELLNHGRDVVVADNYHNSSPNALGVVREIAGRDFAVHEIDMRDTQAVDEVFEAHEIEAVIHFAASKSVRESIRLPLEYYRNNLGSTISLLTAMARHNVSKLVFSGSCSIFGARHSDPIAEDFATGPTNPYASSKLMCEQILRETARHWPALSVISLRYFNPIGAHPTGALGEDPKGVPGNVLPYMMQVAVGRREKLQVYGGDWETPDGSGVRDYVHVMDVAEAHCLALDHLDEEAGVRVFNLGTGVGISVLELIAAFEAASGVTVRYEVIGRQPGDVATLIADPTRLEKAWGWRTSRDLPAMCADAWRFQRLHPNGYAAAAEQCLGLARHPASCA